MTRKWPKFSNKIRGSQCVQLKREMIKRADWLVSSFRACRSIREGNRG